ncbi:uncharacterized protein V1516DRAFT_662048 [Lipomyces oligophaga]|uniref:uncharacterized protein n=1 Tax=Lipomyces oligophaga TaxID=45792 RepID=UPI0034CE3334
MTTMRPELVGPDLITPMDPELANHDSLPSESSPSSSSISPLSPMTTANKNIMPDQSESPASSLVEDDLDYSLESSDTSESEELSSSSERPLKRAQVADQSAVVEANHVRLSRSASISQSSVNSQDTYASSQARNGGSYRRNDDIPFPEIRDLANNNATVRPEYSYRILIACALLSAPRERNHTLRLQEIYESVKQRFPYFAHGDLTGTWRSGIRHTLSHSISFDRYFDGDCAYNSSANKYKPNSSEDGYVWGFSKTSWANQAILVGSRRSIINRSQPTRASRNCRRERKQRTI